VKTPTDKELLDWLDAQCKKQVSPVGRFTRPILGVIFRWSTTGRGWRLHECTGEWGINPAPNVREAIAAAMYRQDPERP
jgi:hypothetical protein